MTDPHPTFTVPYNPLPPTFIVPYPPALFRVISKPPQVSFASLLQLASNVAWNYSFFKLRNPSLSLKCASLYLGLLCATTITFHWTMPVAAVLLMPVLACSIVLFTWNHSVWRNNRVGKPNATLRTLVQRVQQRQADYLGGLCYHAAWWMICQHVSLYVMHAMLV